MSSKERIQGINDLKARSLIQIACVPLDALTFPFSRDLDDENVERLRKAFSEGCFNDKEEYQIPAIISRDECSKGTFRKANGQIKMLYDPPPGTKLQCLRGLHRIRAAESLGRRQPERWLVAMYDADVREQDSSNLIRDLVEEYDSKRIPTEGKFYYKIRHYQGRHGSEADSVLASWWIARLKGHPTKRHAAQHMGRLDKHPICDTAFNRLHHIEVLYRDFTFGSIPRLLTLQCREELVGTSLKQLGDFWYEVFDNDFSLMKEMDVSSLRSLEGKAPGAVEKDWQDLCGNIETGKLFPRLDTSSRKRCFERLCAATRRLQVPTLKTFFKNLLYLETLENCLDRLIDDPQGEHDYFVKARGRRGNCDRHETMRTAFRRAFVHGDSELLVQVDEYNMVRVRIDTENVAFDIAYRQLWLFAIRNQADLPIRKEPKKVGPRGDPANRGVLYKFALLAKALGFMNPAIRGILDPSQHPDRAAVRHMLETTRKGLAYPDMEHSIDVCIAQLNTAIPKMEQLESDEPECADKVEPWGKPLSAHAKADRQRLFLHVLHKPDDGRKQRILSSYFVARSQYFSWLGEELAVDLNITDDLPRIPLSSLESSRATVEMRERPENMQEHNDRIKALNNEELQLQDQLKTLEGRLSALRAHEEQLKHGIGKLENHGNSLTADTNRLVDNNKRLEDDKKQLEGINDHLKEEAKKLKVEIEAFTQKRDDNKKLEGINDALKEEEKKLKAEIEALTQNRDAIQRLLDDLREEYRVGGHIRPREPVATSPKRQSPPPIQADTVAPFSLSDDDSQESDYTGGSNLNPDVEAGRSGGRLHKNETHEQVDDLDTNMKFSGTEDEAGEGNVTVRIVAHDVTTKSKTVHRVKTKEEATEKAAELQGKNFVFYIYKATDELDSNGIPSEVACLVAHDDFYKEALKTRRRSVLAIRDLQGVPGIRKRKRDDDVLQNDDAPRDDDALRKDDAPRDDDAPLMLSRDASKPTFATEPTSFNQPPRPYKPGERMAPTADEGAESRQKKRKVRSENENATSESGVPTNSRMK